MNSGSKSFQNIKEENGWSPSRQWRGFSQPKETPVLSQQNQSSQGSVSGSQQSTSSQPSSQRSRSSLPPSQRLTVQDDIAPGMARCFTDILRMTENDAFRQYMMEMIEAKDLEEYEQKFQALVVTRFRRFCPQKK